MTSTGPIDYSGDVRDVRVLEVDTDNLTAEQAKALDALGVSMPELSTIEDEKFGSVEDLFSQETEERAGRWFVWPVMPGAEVFIAHASAARSKIIKLEQQFRAKHQKGPTEQLSTGAWLFITRDGFFGTVVKDWRGMKLRDGTELGFTEANYQKLWETRRFSDFVLDKARSEDDWRAKNQESVGKS